MAWNATDLASIETAIARGEQSVTYSDGRSVTFRSVADLLKARDAIKAAVGTGTGNTSPRFSFASHSKE